MDEDRKKKRIARLKIAGAAASVMAVGFGSWYAWEDAKDSQVIMVRNVDDKDAGLFEGQNVYWEVQEIMRNIEENDVPEFVTLKREVVKQMAYHMYLFRCRGKAHILDLPTEFTKDAPKLAELTKINGEPFFECKDIARYTRYGGTLDYAVEMASVPDGNGDNLFYGAQLPHMFAFKLKPEDFEFIDTEKPDTLLVYPTYDLNDDWEEGPFAVKEGLDLYKKFKEESDVKLVIASREEEVYGPLKNHWVNFRRGFRTFMAVGHGNKYGLRLGRGCKYRFCSDEENEKYYLDVDDTELATYLGFLDPDAVTFLNSCATAEDGMDPNNFANRIGYFSDGKKIIASTVPFGQRHIKVKSINPFDARIVITENYYNPQLPPPGDYTYVVEGKPPTLMFDEVHIKGKK